MRRGKFNSRPITYLSEDPKDLSALTPSMFLQKIKEIGVPELDIIDPKKLNKRYSYRLRLRQDLRNRFRIEYLGLLKDNSKIKRESSIKEVDLVLIGDSNNKRIHWPLAKVEKTYPGKDGRVRLVELKTQSGKLLRPIQRLFPLEVKANVFPSVNNSGRHDESPCHNKDLIPANKEVRYSRYGRSLKPTKRL
nr:uncharacterized protein LOC122269228 [Parasteatoda tepidariorum]